jgi:hypothetical protein
MEQINKTKLYVVGTLLAGFFVAGCGGSSSSAESLSKPQFVREATAICADAQVERAEALKDVLDEKPELADLTSSALLSVEEMTEELGALGPPPGDAKEVQAIIDAYEAGIKKIKADPGDLTGVLSTFTKANQLAEEYGLTDCTI